MEELKENLIVMLKAYNSLDCKVTRDAAELKHLIDLNIKAIEVIHSCH